MLLLIDPLLNETDYWAPPPGNATRLALNQILPVLGAGLSKLTVDGAPVTLPADMASAPSFASAASALPTVGLLQGGAAAVTRVFHADSCGQASGPTSQLRGDAGDVGGLEYHALRLETVLYDGAGSAVDVRDACRDSGLLRVGLIAAVFGHQLRWWRLERLLGGSLDLIHQLYGVSCQVFRSLALGYGKRVSVSISAIFGGT